MHIFDDDIARLRSYVESRRSSDQPVRVFDLADEEPRQPISSGQGASTIVFSEDTHLELGHPGSFSTAPVLVTEDLGLVNDGAITLIGPDVSEISGQRSFAQILIIGSEDLQDEDYRKINSHQYTLELTGYMIKAVPSSLTLWSRISNQSVAEGFCFEALGNAIIESYRSVFAVSSMEVIFVTSSDADVEELRDLHQKVTRTIQAMNKMIEEMSFDCSACEYLDVCGDVRQLGALRDRLMKQREAEQK